MHLPGQCVNEGTLVLNYRPTIVAHTQTNPSSSRRGDPISKHIHVSNETNFGQGSLRSAEPRSTVRVRASSNLLDWSELTTYKDWKAEESEFESQ
jgi:hypothetical protein